MGGAEEFLCCVCSCSKLLPTKTGFQERINEPDLEEVKEAQGKHSINRRQVGSPNGRRPSGFVAEPVSISARPPPNPRCGHPGDPPGVGSRIVPAPQPFGTGQLGAVRIGAPANPTLMSKSNLKPGRASLWERQL